MARVSLGAKSGGSDSVYNLNGAVEACSNALLVFARESQPQYWAMVQNNLSVAFRDLAGQLTERDDAI